MSEARAAFPPHRAVRRLCVPYRAGLYGSTEQAVTALLRLSDADMDDAEIARLKDKIRRARLSGR